MIDSSSHVYAALTGQTFVGSQADLAMIVLAEVVLNIGRKVGQKPVRLPGPYTGAEKRRKRREAHVEPKVKKQLTERLQRYSSIPD